MIRMTKLAAGPSGVMEVGSEHDLAPDVEAEYVRSGAAVRIGEVVEVATAPEPKQTAAKRKTRARRKK